jgi:quercetin dioxygenase-like cupin family protein
MRTRLLWFLVAIFAVARVAAAQHVMMTPGQIKWGPAPPALPAGAQAAVLDGDPGKAGPFTIRLKFPDGFKIPPHWHPSDENLVIIQGVFRIGTGDKLDAAAATDLSVGSYAHMPKETHHFALTKGETIVQVYSTGPFVLNYVNPADDPRKTTTK